MAPPAPSGRLRRALVPGPSSLQRRFLLYFAALIVLLMLPVVLLVEKRTGLPVAQP